MKTLPPLYSRTSTGATQVWEISIDKNKFRVSSGQIDGKKVISEWTVCDGKNIGRANETSPEDQARSEAKAKWEKKAKTGYTTDIGSIDTCTSFVEPMLAKNFNDYVDKINFVDGGVLVQSKYNGVRCIAVLEGDKVVLKSRKGELWVSCQHINQDLEKFFKKFPDAVLDGELYNYDLRQKLNLLIKLVRKSVNIGDDDLAKSEEMVRFYVYDGYFFGGMDQSAAYINRKKWIDENLPKYSKYYRPVETTPAQSMKEVNKVYEKYLADGEEGAIIRFSSSPYENKRSKYLLKFKPQEDSEGVVVAIMEGTGNWSGTAKTAKIRWEGKTFDATFRGTQEQGAERLKNPKDWIGKTVTFLYNGLTGLGTPNFARIDPDNCFKGDR